MLLNLFAGLFRKHCPLCKLEVHAHCGGAVQRFGRWFCSENHADLYELELYDALRTVHCRHTSCHGEHVPLPEAVGLSFSPKQNFEAACPNEYRLRCFTPSS